ncbi:DUF5683 domain-containing protein [Paenimyroides tangerinum]|uniref:DUF5683 domain-containing protein n=1 Tax=Paenimyroides tangerinum TaxID=2488728 RepID=UPI001F21D61D|nr:DUF5683 domain-containing protein [Paenimyroides tangerinum]
MQKVIGFLIISLFSYGICSAQEADSLKLKTNTLTKQAIDPLSPAKAAFYSAVVPGLGQIYNKSYWKVPIVYAGIGTGMYFYIDNQKKYLEYRNEYKRRLQGIHDVSDPKFGRLDNDRLITGQRYYQKNRDLSLVITIAIYALNIVDANVDAHLQQFNVDDDLSFRPSFQYNEFNGTYQFGAQLTFKF